MIATGTKKIWVMAFLLLFIWHNKSYAKPPCQTPSPQSGWSTWTFNNTSVVSGYVYDLNDGILFSIMKSGLVNWEFEVPSRTVQMWNYNPTPDAYYSSYVSAPFHWGLLTETCNELLAENGSYLWSK